MSRFPSARAGPKDRDQVLPRTYFAPPKKPGKAAIVSRKLLRGLGDSGTRCSWDTWRGAGGGAGPGSPASSCLDSPTSCPQTLERRFLSLSLSTRPGSLSDLSRGPGPPPAPGHCVVPCPYSRRLWNCRAPAFTVLSHDAPQPSPTPRAPPADDSLLRLCCWRSGLFGGEKPDSGRARCGDPGDCNNPVSPASPGQVQSQSW